jgi:hypothetical protein
MMPTDFPSCMADQHQDDLWRDAQRHSAYRPHDVMLPAREPRLPRLALGFATLLLAAGARLQRRYHPALDDCVTC